MAPALTRSAREDQVREATRDARVRATARLFFPSPPPPRSANPPLLAGRDRTPSRPRPGALRRSPPRYARPTPHDSRSDHRPDPHPFPRLQQARGMPRADPPITTAVPAAGSPVDGTTTRAQVRRRRRPRRRRLGRPPPRRRARCRARRRLRRRRVSRRRRAARRAPRRGPSPRRRRRASRERHARPRRAHQGPRLALAGHPVGQGWPRRDPGDSRRLRFPPRRPRVHHAHQVAAAAASGRRRWSSTPP